MPELRQRQPRIQNKAFLAFVRTRPCCACGAPPKSQAAHLKRGCQERGKRPAGSGEKPSDMWAVPLCADCHLDGHRAQHKVGETQFWHSAGKDPFAIAARLYALFEAERGPQPQHIVRVTGMRPKRLNGIYIFHINKSKPKRKWPKQAFPKGRKLRSRRK